MFHPKNWAHNFWHRPLLKHNHHGLMDNCTSTNLFQNAEYLSFIANIVFLALSYRQPLYIIYPAVTSFLFFVFYMHLIFYVFCCNHCRRSKLFWLWGIPVDNNSFGNEFFSLSLNEYQLQNQIVVVLGKNTLSMQELDSVEAMLYSKRWYSNYILFLCIGVWYKNMLLIIFRL